MTISIFGKCSYMRWKFSWLMWRHDCPMRPKHNSQYWHQQWSWTTPNSNIRISEYTIFYVLLAKIKWDVELKFSTQFSLIPMEFIFVHSNSKEYLLQFFWCDTSQKASYQFLSSFTIFPIFVVVVSCEVFVVVLITSSWMCVHYLHEFLSSFPAKLTEHQHTKIE